MECDVMYCVTEELILFEEVAPSTFGTFYPEYGDSSTTVASQKTKILV
jgi:hypothetical protein